MLDFSLEAEASFDPLRHVEKILGTVENGDVTVACWSPGQISPFHCHPSATEIYFCVRGGGVMRTPDRAVDIRPGAFVVHPPGEVHEYINGPEDTLLFRVRYGESMESKHLANRGHAAWVQREADAAYYREHPVEIADLAALRPATTQADGARHG